MRTIMLAPVPLALLIACSHACFGQTKTLHVNLDRLPARIIVQKGTVLELGGDLPDGEVVLPTSFTLRCGPLVRASGTFKKQWKLLWDPSREVGSMPVAILYRAETGQQEVRVARIPVQVIDSPLFRMTSPVDRLETDASVSVKVVALEKAKLTGGDILIDGKTCGAKIDDSGAGSVNLIGRKPGGHAISVNVGMDTGGDFETDSVRVILKPRISLSREEVGPLDLTRGPTRIPLKVTMPDGFDAKFAEFYVDGKLAGRSDAAPFDDAALSTEGIGTGSHVFSVAVVTKSGERHVSADLPVDVVGNAKGEFSKWLERLQRVLDDAETARAEFREVDQGYASQAMTIGDLNEALKKLYASDMHTEFAVEKLEVPTSLSRDDRDTLVTALGDLRAGFSRLVREEEFGLTAIKTNTQYEYSTEQRLRINTNMNNAMLKIASANAKVQSVAEHLENGPESRAALLARLKYATTGNAARDFVAWRAQLEMLIDDAEAVRQEYDTEATTAANIIPLNKAISTDTWMEQNIEKLVPPKALAVLYQQKLSAALQNISAAYRYRANAEKVLRRRLEVYLNLADKQAGLSGTVSADGGTESTLFNKAQITLSQAKEQVKSVARGLGVGD